MEDTFFYVEFYQTYCRGNVYLYNEEVTEFSLEAYLKTYIDKTEKNLDIDIRMWGKSR